MPLPRFAPKNTYMILDTVLQNHPTESRRFNGWFKVPHYSGLFKGYLMSESPLWKPKAKEIGPKHEWEIELYCAKPLRFGG